MVLTVCLSLVQAHGEDTCQGNDGVDILLEKLRKATDDFDEKNAEYLVLSSRLEKIAKVIVAGNRHSQNI